MFTNFKMAPLFFFSFSSLNFFFFLKEIPLSFTLFINRLTLRKLINLKKLATKFFNYFFFFFFQPFPSVRGGHSISSFSTSFCLQHPSPSHQLPAYLPLLHLKLFSLVSLFSSFPVTPFPSFFFLHTLGLSS